jgi:hypothetical protein
MVVGEPIATGGMSTRDITKITERARETIAYLYYSRCLVPDLRGTHLLTNEPKK